MSSRPAYSSRLPGSPRRFPKSQPPEPLPVLPTTHELHLSLTRQVDRQCDFPGSESWGRAADIVFEQVRWITMRYWPGKTGVPPISYVTDEDC